MLNDDDALLVVGDGNGELACDELTGDEMGGGKVSS